MGEAAFPLSGYLLKLKSSPPALGPAWVKR
jgi:hypothetical protein